MALGRQYRFGPFQLDVEERELRRDGEVIALTAKTFDLLLILVQGAGRTFTKSELLNSLWPGAVVEESNLSQTIFLLRKALGENGDNGDYVRTLPRRGYKFIAVVNQQDIDSPYRQRIKPTMPVFDSHGYGLRSQWSLCSPLAH